MTRLLQEWCSTRAKPANSKSGHLSQKLIQHPLLVSFGQSMRMRVLKDVWSLTTASHLGLKLRLNVANDTTLTATARGASIVDQAAKDV